MFLCINDDKDRYDEIKIKATSCGKACIELEKSCLPENLDSLTTKYWSEDKNWEDRALVKNPGDKNYIKDIPSE